MWLAGVGCAVGGGEKLWGGLATHTKELGLSAGDPKVHICLLRYQGGDFCLEGSEEHIRSYVNLLKLHTTCSEYVRVGRCVCMCAFFPGKVCLCSFILKYVITLRRGEELD